MDIQIDDVMLLAAGWIPCRRCSAQSKRTGCTFWSFYRCAGSLPTMPPLISPSSQPSISSS